jgi:uncharacterized protein (DUF58 family)
LRRSRSFAIARPSPKPTSRRRWGGWVFFHLTRIGWVHTAATLIVGIVALTSGHNFMYLMFGVAVGAILVHGFASWRNLRGLSVHRHLPASAMAGAEVQIRYEVRSRRPKACRYTRWALRVVERPSAQFTPRRATAFVLRMDGGKLAHGVARIRPARRGLLALDRFFIRSRYPFALGDRYVRFSQPQMMVVWPQMGWLSGQLFERVASARTMWNRRERRGVGQDEFYGLREYRDGDNPRWIHWKTTARRGELIVREFEAQQSGRVAILLDTMADPADPEAVAHRERAISLAATIARDATRLGYEISLVAYDDRLHAIRPGRGLGHLSRVLDCLALLGNNPGTPLSGAIHRTDPAVLRGAFAVVIGADGRAGRGLAGLETRRLRPLVAAANVVDVTDPKLGRLFRLEGGPGQAAGDRAGRPAARPRRRRRVAAKGAAG